MTRREQKLNPKLDILYQGGIGVLRTNDQFVVVLKERFYGPFWNDQIDKVITMLEEI